MENNNKNKPGNYSKYASAPYNFIPFPEKIVYRHDISSGKNEGVPDHDKFRSDLKTGYIEYTIEVKTPLFIGNGEDEFFNINGSYVIPGSTIRGKIRSNAEILSYSYPEFVKNTKLWYRGAFSDDVLKNMYKKELLPEKESKINESVKAGYLVKEKSKYKIIPAKADENGNLFRLIHESKLRKSYVDRDIDDNLKEKIFMYNYVDKQTGEKLWDKFWKLKSEKKNLSKKVNELEKKAEKLSFIEADEKKKLEGMINSVESNLKDLLINNNHREFTEYYCSVSYRIDDRNEIVIKKIKNLNNSKEDGLLMNSVNLQKKQNHYLIYKKDTELTPIEINKEIINEFKTSVKYKHNKIAEDFNLDTNNNFKEKPIFYILNKNKEIIAFGFTPYLKIPYDKATNDGIRIEKDDNRIDYVQSIFGIVNLDHKGRVSFTNAELLTDNEFEESTFKSLMKPKISSFQLYLKQPNSEKRKLKTYSEDFELRGQKFYWLKDDYNSDDDCEIQFRKNKNIKKEDLKKQFSKIKPIKVGAKFIGKIYFENLHDDELGLMLKSIKPFEEAKDNLGQGKPYGFGKIEFNIIDVKEIDSIERFKSINLNYDNNEKKSIDIKIEKYEGDFYNYMKNQNIIIDYKKNDRLKSFYISKNEEKEAKDKDFQYMEVKSFKDRKILKHMSEYIKENLDKEPLTKEDLEKMLSGKFNVSKRKR